MYTPFYGFNTYINPLENATINLAIALSFEPIPEDINKMPSYLEKKHWA